MRLRRAACFLRGTKRVLQAETEPEADSGQAVPANYKESVRDARAPPGTADDSSTRRSLILKSFSVESLSGLTGVSRVGPPLAAVIITQDNTEAGPNKHREST